MDLTCILDRYTDFRMLQLDPVCQVLRITAGRFHHDMQFLIIQVIFYPVEKLFHTLWRPFEIAARQGGNFVLSAVLQLVDSCGKTLFANVKSDPDFVFSSTHT